MNKKNIIKSALVALVILIVIGGAIFYKFAAVKPTTQPETQNQQETTQSEPPQNPPGQPPALVPDVQVETKEPGIVICADLCGDGVCQDKVATCGQGSLNCSCQESKQECPQDCK